MFIIQSKITANQQKKNAKQNKNWRWRKSRRINRKLVWMHHRHGIKFNLTLFPSTFYLVLIFFLSFHFEFPGIKNFEWRELLSSEWKHTVTLLFYSDILSHLFLYSFLLISLFFESWKEEMAFICMCVVLCKGKRNFQFIYKSSRF